MPRVLGVLLFAAFWVVVAVGLFYVAARGGPSRVGASSRRPGRGANRAIGIVCAVVVVGVGLVLPLVLLVGNGDNANGQVGGVKLSAAERNGRELFGSHCAVCHTLAAANAIGKVGPNLDLLKPTQSTVVNTINNGCLPNAPSGSSEDCLGQGVMPADVVTGRNATDVAEFVAKVAGNE